MQLKSRALWDFYHAEGIARDVRNETVAAWDEAHMFRCLAWLYDGFRIPDDSDSAWRRRSLESAHVIARNLRAND